MRSHHISENSNAINTTQVISSANLKHAVSGYQSDKMQENSRKKIPYPRTSDADLIIQEGDALWQYRPSHLSAPRSDSASEVRASLSGLVFEEHSIDFSDPSRNKQVINAINYNLYGHSLQFWQRFHFFGHSQKAHDCGKTTFLGDPPLAIRVGQMTVPHYGPAKLHAGQLVLYSLPDPSRPQRYSNTMGGGTISQSAFKMEMTPVTNSMIILNVSDIMVKQMLSALGQNPPSVGIDPSAGFLRKNGLKQANPNFIADLSEFQRSGRFGFFKFLQFVVTDKSLQLPHDCFSESQWLAIARQFLNVTFPLTLSTFICQFFETPTEDMFDLYYFLQQVAGQDKVFDGKFRILPILNLIDLAIASQLHTGELKDPVFTEENTRDLDLRKLLPYIGFEPQDRANYNDNKRVLILAKFRYFEALVLSTAFKAQNFDATNFRAIYYTVNFIFAIMMLPENITALQKDPSEFHAFMSYLLEFEDPASSPESYTEFKTKGLAGIEVSEDTRSRLNAFAAFLELYCCTTVRPLVKDQYFKSFSPQTEPDLKDDIEVQEAWKNSKELLRETNSVNVHGTTARFLAEIREKDGYEKIDLNGKSKLDLMKNLKDVLSVLTTHLDEFETKIPQLTAGDVQNLNKHEDKVYQDQRGQVFVSRLKLGDNNYGFLVEGHTDDHEIGKDYIRFFNSREFKIELFVKFHQFGFENPFDSLSEVTRKRKEFIKAADKLIGDWKDIAVKLDFAPKSSDLPIGFLNEQLHKPVLASLVYSDLDYLGQVLGAIPKEDGTDELAGEAIKTIKASIKQSLEELIQKIKIARQFFMIQEDLCNLVTETNVSHEQKILKQLDDFRKIEQVIPSSGANQNNLLPNSGQQPPVGNQNTAFGTHQSVHPTHLPSEEMETDGTDETNGNSASIHPLGQQLNSNQFPVSGHGGSHHVPAFASSNSSHGYKHMRPDHMIMYRANKSFKLLLEVVALNFAGVAASSAQSGCDFDLCHGPHIGQVMSE